MGNILEMLVNYWLINIIEKQELVCQQQAGYGEMFNVGPNRTLGEIDAKCLHGKTTCQSRTGIQFKIKI